MRWWRRWRRRFRRWWTPPVSTTSAGIVETRPTVVHTHAQMREYVRRGRS